MRIDLHAHTTCSDGTLTPAELVRLAWQRGLGALAVTDHDTTAGLAEAHRVGAELGVEILDGCEVTALLPSGIAHVLAYGFDVESARFQGLLERVRKGRDQRNGIILGKLEALGVAVDYDSVCRHAAGEVVARPHIAAAMVEQGHVDDLREAFQRFLKDGGAAYAEAPVPPAAEVVEEIVAAGGVAVLAHPRSLRMGSRRAYRQVFLDLKAAGLAGIEVHHPSQDSNMRRMFESLAVELDLVVSAGSDFHGSTKPHLELGTGDGTIEVTYATWKALHARRREAA